jgi:hypothetical protein
MWWATPEPSRSCNDGEAVFTKESGTGFARARSQARLTKAR